MDVKVGDVVHVDAQVVKIVSDFDASVRLNVNGTLIWVMPACIKHVEPRPLQVGDKVKRPMYCADGGTIVAIHYDNAWVRHDAGGYTSWPLATLERA